MHIALDECFEKYVNTELTKTGEGPISEKDKQTLKYNLRKQDLFEQALFFSFKLFEVSPHLKLCPKLMLEWTSCCLAIVLSHHF